MREVLGYPSVVQIFAGVGVVLAALTYVVVPDVKPLSIYDSITGVLLCKTFQNR